MAEHTETETTETTTTEQGSTIRPLAGFAITADDGTVTITEKETTTTKTEDDGA